MVLRRTMMVAVTLAFTFNIVNATAWAASGEDKEISPDPDERLTHRYSFRMINGKMYRLDKQTGKMELLTLPDVPTAKGVTKGEAKKKTVAEDRTLLAMKVKPNSPPKIHLVNNDVVDPEAIRTKPVVTKVTQTERIAARSDVGGYNRQLSLIQLVEVSGDDIKGTLSVSNKGPKRIEALELTLFVPTSGEQIVKHRFLLGSRQGQQPAPQPASRKEDKPDPIFVKVDVPAPTGIKGKIDTRVTYIKFAEN